MDFWNAFSRRLGCENPSETIARQQAWQRSVGHIGTILFFVVAILLLVVHLQTLGSTGSAVSIGVLGAIGIGLIIIWPMLEIARAQKIADILRREQEPFSLTSGSVALSNLGITPPPGTQWWWTGRVAFVFVRSLVARFSVDALGHSLIWEDSLESNIVSRNTGLTGQVAAGILQNLLTANFRYRRLVETFHTLSSLDEEYRFLEALKTEVEQKISEELRVAELRVEELRSTQARGRRQQDASQNAQEPRIPRPTPVADTNRFLGHVGHPTEPEGDAAGLLQNPAQLQRLPSSGSPSAKGPAAPWATGLRQDSDRKNSQCKSRATLHCTFH
jgi:hypothetical protein